MGTTFDCQRSLDSAGIVVNQLLAYEHQHPQRNRATAFQLGYSQVKIPAYVVVVNQLLAYEHQHPLRNRATAFQLGYSQVRIPAYV